MADPHIPCSVWKYFWKGSQNLYLAVAPSSVLGVIILQCLKQESRTTFALKSQGCQHHHRPWIAPLCCWRWTTHRLDPILSNWMLDFSVMATTSSSSIGFTIVCCSGPPLFGWLVDITSSYSLPLAIAASSQVMIKTMMLTNGEDNEANYKYDEVDNDSIANLLDLMGEGINILQLVDDVSMILRIFKRFAQLGAQQSPPGFIGGSNMRKRSYSCCIPNSCKPSSCIPSSCKPEEAATGNQASEH